MRIGQAVGVMHCNVDSATAFEVIVQPHRKKALVTTREYCKVEEEVMSKHRGECSIVKAGSYHVSFVANSHLLGQF